ncbi:MAG TPA: hypothetical protein VMS60_06190 [Solirubrobacterales bacterium]|nr:hypothetical protein [Solirubrobacterales bacterium]
MRVEMMSPRTPKPALPDLKRRLVDMAATQAQAAEGRRPRRHLGRRIALGAAVASVGAALVMVSGGGGSGVLPEPASAADLNQAAAMLPRLQLAGPWQIASTEMSPDGGRIEYRSEEEGDQLHRFHATEAEIQWHSDSIADRAGQLESEGFAFAEQIRSKFGGPAVPRSDEFVRREEARNVHVYVSGEDGEEDFCAVALWLQGDETFEYRATVVSVWEIERLMERIELLSEEEWVIALLPGGGKWLADTASGMIQKVEQVKVGETPDGQPIFQAQALIGSSTGKALDFRSALPVIYREGDTTRLVIEQPPPGVERGSRPSGRD